MRWLQLSAFAALVAAGALLCVPVRAAGDRQLERLVIQDCGSCHGLTMKGGLGRPLTPEALEGQDVQTLAGIILDGIPGTAMPAWRPLLSEPDALWIARYLKARKP
jgi:cytochrome c55X